MNLATDGAVLVAPGAGTSMRPVTDAADLAAAARDLVPGRELVIHVHEAAGPRWKLPAQLPSLSAAAAKRRDHPLPFVRRAAAGSATVRSIGDRGYAIVESEGPAVHLAFPTYSGDFADTADVDELLESVELFRAAVGLAFVFSAPSTIHKLIATTGHRVHAPAPAPALEPDYTPCAWSVPAHEWIRDLDAEERRLGWVRVFDRAGSYLAAWRGCTLGDGGWSEWVGPAPLEPGPESGRPAGYSFVDLRPLRDLLAGEFPDPFDRHLDDGGRVWLTTPLLQLAAELAEPIGVTLTVERGWFADERVRPLDVAAERLASARKSLAELASDAAATALEVVKEGYAGAVAWFEYGPRPPSPLARPDWRHTIIDRHAANTFRGLWRAWPFGLTGVDAAMFAVAGPEEIPEGLRVGSGLGAWKPKGRPVPMQHVLEALERFGHGPRTIVQLAEERDR